MSPGLMNRLREASVVVRSPQVDELRSAIDKFAAVSQPSIADQIARIRLAFGEDVEAEAASRHDQQWASAGIHVGSRDVQLRRILAACVLVERFGRPPGRRRRPSLRADTVAALAVRLRARAGRVSVHPDVLLWADYWVETLARVLRKGGRVAAPPLPDLQVPAVDPSLPANEAVQSAFTQSLGQLTSYAEELMEWSAEVDSTGLAAQEEQSALLWWLTSSHSVLPPPATVVEAARELSSRVSVTPGPPQAQDLLRRRLGSVVRQTISVKDITSALVEEQMEDELGLFPLLGSWDGLDAVKDTGDSMALWVYDELTLKRLIEETP